MSYFAKIDDNNIVTQVIVAEQEFIDSGAVGDSSIWIETSFNHKFRKQYAGIGYTYDKTNDVFIEPQPWSSWTLDINHNWQAPTAKPDDGGGYVWNEETQVWDTTGQRADGIWQE